MIDMTIEGKTWIAAHRRTDKTQSGGIHIYVDAETLSKSLRFADIPINSELKVKRYPIKCRKRVAKIILEIRER